jgi:hypothetical protein
MKNTIYKTRVLESEKNKGIKRVFITVHLLTIVMVIYSFKFSNRVKYKISCSVSFNEKVFVNCKGF